MVMAQKAIQDLVEIGTAVAGADETAAARSAAAEAAGADGKIGERLRAAREAAGFTLVEIFSGTKVKIGILEAIEAGDRARLPATPFTAGFVKAYAQFLGLDAGAYAALYRAEVMGEDAAKAAAAAPPLASEAAPLVYRAPVFAEAPVKARSAPGFAASPEKLVSYFGIGASLILVGWIGAMVIAPKRSAETAPVVLQTAEPAPAPVALTPSPVPVGTAATGSETIVTPTLEAAATEGAQDIVDAEIVPPAIRTPRVKPPAPVLLVDATAFDIDADALNAAQAEAVEEMPPAPVAAPEPILVSARLVRPATPKYPERCAARAKARESVDVRVDIGPDGTPQNPRVAATSNACFDAAAVQTALRMQFAPATADGAPRLESGKAITIEFLK